MVDTGFKKLSRQSIRFSDPTWEELDAIVVKERERTRELVTVSGIVRQFVTEGIARFKQKEAKERKDRDRDQAEALREV